MKKIAFLLYVALTHSGCASSSASTLPVRSESYKGSPGSGIQFSSDDLHLESTVENPAVPPMVCKVMMKSWCVLNSINLTDRIDLGNDLILRFSNTYFVDGPVTVVASKMCDNLYETNPKKLHEVNEIDGNGNGYLSIKYSLDAENICLLDIRMPIAADKLRPIYRSTMLTSIRICSAGVCNLNLTELE